MKQFNRKSAIITLAMKNWSSFVCCIVTRFGEISPLRLIFSVFRDNCKKISIWQKVFIFWPNLCCWAIFICFKWPNIEQKIYPSGHIIYLSKQTDSSEMQFSTQNFGILDVYLFEENYFFLLFTNPRSFSSKYLFSSILFFVLIRESIRTHLRI